MLRLVVAALVLAAPPAHADDERGLSVGLGWATFSAPGEPEGMMEPVAIAPDVGGALAISYERMIGSEFGLRAELAGGLFYGGADEEKGQSPTTTAVLGDAGAVFRFDVLKYVPFAFAGVGGVATFGGPIPEEVDVVLAVGGGLDILLSRTRSIGVEARVASFGGDITIFTLGVRGTARWGFF